MPQDIMLDIPFAVKISPHVQTERAAHVNWLKSAGVFQSQENIERYMTWTLVELAGRFYPDVSESDLALGLQGLTFFFLFDDLFDSRLGEDPAAAYALCHEMAALARQSPGAGQIKPSFPLARLWLSHWRRTQEGMSAAWRERAARHWEQYFLVYVTETSNRKCGISLAINQYLALRRQGIGTEGVLNTAERCGHFEAPPEIHQSICMLEIRDITADVVILANDLHSLEKDRVNGELNNIVLLLSNEYHCSQEEAIKKVQSMVRQRTERFQQLVAETKRLFDVFDLSEEQRTSTLRFIDANCAVMRGNYDWSNATDRYSQVGVHHVKRSPRIEDTIARTAW